MKQLSLDPTAFASGDTAYNMGVGVSVSESFLTDWLNEWMNKY